ncbi:hypothetical protein [Microbispora sp. H11081]|uniref:hypothetical protein n=1 Tax=Microbispora sp. H11081 TaxID=2729107 RepID=UPI001472F33D|nr:hypothetical protein [Microbispora sp. H11081]
MTVAGGLALGMPGAAAAQTVGFTVTGEGVYPPRPVTVENVVTPVVTPVVENDPGETVQPVCTGENCNNNNGWWPMYNSPMWGGNGPGVWTNNDTSSNTPTQPVVAPGGMGGNEGVAPVQNAFQNADGAPEAATAAMPAEDVIEEGEEPGEEPDEDTYEEEAPDGMGPEGMADGGGYAPTAAGPGGPAGGPGLPFTGAPMGVAAAGAGLLAVALGGTLMSARRRRSSGAE